MPPRKRHIECIDLTNDDLPRLTTPPRQVAPTPSVPPKRPRVSLQHSRPRPAAASSSKPTALLADEAEEDEDDDEDAASEEVSDASQGYSEAQLSYGLYGVVHTKIVGVRYYNGVATPGEMTILRREPHNPYDRNAIQVLNVQRLQIGHIPRILAEKLARYLDNRTLLPEAIISGPKEMFDCPIELRLYGTNDPIERENLVAQMRADKLPVASAMEQERRENNARKEQAKLAAQAARDAKKKGGAVVGVAGQQFANGRGEYAAGSSAGGMGPAPTLQDIVSGSEVINPRNVAHAVEQFGVKEKDLQNMPRAAQPEGILTSLHPFQLQGLQWMLDKESPQLPPQNSNAVVQLWQRHPRIKGAFTNLATCFSIVKPELASGGILADDMGLGKTIQLVALILADRALNRKAAGVADATLILAPVSVMSNWAAQMKRHIKPEHALRVMFYHGTRKEKISPKEIENYDVVISTYETVSSEWAKNKNAGPFSIKWRRIILDEAHIIRSPKAKRTVAVTNLSAQSRWCLTGTPIINNLKDLYSLVKFLRLSGGLDNFEVFHSAVIRPIQQGDAKRSEVLQVLMRDMCLRRKKEHKFIDLKLPELTEYVHRIEFLPHEKEKYEALEAQAKGTLDIYRSKIGASGRDAFVTYRHLLEVLLRMRQLCNHWRLVGQERFDDLMKQLEAEGVLDLTEENRTMLQEMLKLAIESQEDCPVCLESFTQPLITRCAHVFCTACIERVIDTQHKCPMCRAELESLATTTVKPAKELTGVALAPTQADLKNEEVLSKDSSSKIEALLSILQASAKDPTNKTIIFSQWTSFLDLVEPHLSASGSKYTRIDGSMTAPQRDAALEVFDNDPDTTILLASLSVCSVGLNLVAANKVILADSWWAPAIEDQAVDRVHRLGQTRETTVFRLVVKDSVEENVLRIQEDKRKLMGLAFAEREVRRAKRGGGASLGDLERLLGTAGPAGGANASSSRAESSRT